MPESLAPKPVALRRSMGLAGAVAVVVGGVVGVGIFVLVAHVAAKAGPALWLAFAVALLLSVASTIPIIQLASALPRAGGGYVFVSRMLSPLLGVLTSQWVVLGGAFSSCLVALGLAEYLVQHLPGDVGARPVAALMLLGVYFVLRRGTGLAVGLQVLMVLQMMAVLVAYVGAGAWRYGAAPPLHMPQGGVGFFEAVVLAYSICMGLQVLGEIGEEVRGARRNIPLALLIGAAAILVLYAAVGIVFVQSQPYDYEALMTMEAPLKQSAEQFMPGWFAPVLSLAVLFAGLTSLNAGAVALPRELFAQARDGLLPAALAQIDARTRSPLNAVTAYFAIVLTVLASGVSVAFCGYVVAVGFSMLSILVNVASLRLIRRFPERYAAAYVHFPQPVLALCTITAVLCSAGFIALVLLEHAAVVWIYGVWTAAVLVYYVRQVRRLAGQGVDIRAAARIIPGHDEQPETAE